MNGPRADGIRFRPGHVALKGGAQVHAEQCSAQAGKVMEPQGPRRRKDLAARTRRPTRASLGGRVKKWLDHCPSQIGLQIIEPPWVSSSRGFFVRRQASQRDRTVIRAKGNRHPAIPAAPHLTPGLPPAAIQEMNNVRFNSWNWRSSFAEIIYNCAGQTLKCRRVRRLEGFKIGLRNSLSAALLLTTAFNRNDPLASDPVIHGLPLTP